MIITIAAYPERGSAYTECFYSALRKAGFEIFDGDFSIKWLLKNIKKIRYFHFHWPSFFYAQRSDVKKMVQNFIRYLAFILIIKLSNSKIVWTAHNLYPHDTKNNKIGHIIDILARHIVVFVSSLIIVHGKNAANILASEFPMAKSKIAIIDHGNWIDYYRNQTSSELAKKILNIPSDKYTLLFIGLCKEYKNIDYLVKTFKNLKGNNILLIAGKFPSIDYLKKVKSLSGVDINIKIEAKYIEDDYLQIYLNACDAVVLPYKDILTSGTAMLAISFGKPVIAPRLGYLADVINEDCGILYDHNNQEALSEAMQKIKEKRYDRNKIILYASSYKWDTIASRFKEAINTIN